jgi:cyclophilin family peptidyl-prolyl cis-trans isomerase
VAYANSGGTDTANSQFYIVTAGPVDADTLEQYEEHGYGPYTDEQKELYTTIGGAPWLDGSYTVFGQVVEGLDVAIAISEIQDKDSNNKPYTSVVMESVTIEPYDGSELHWYASE